MLDCTSKLVPLICDLRKSEPETLKEQGGGVTLTQRGLSHEK